MKIDSRVTGKTYLLGIVGNPVGHSISPQLHNTISKNLGVETIYVPFKVEKACLENAVKGLKALEVLGFNVTIPYKKEIMKYLDENTKEALLMGAVNTVKNIDGRLYGYNTDAEGFSRSFKEETGTGFRDKNIVILGAGGAARAIAVKVAIEGAASITIANRTLSKAQDISEIISNNYMCSVKCCNFEEKGFIDAVSSSNIIINTTPAGMHPNTDECPVGKSVAFNSSQIVYDAIYNPVKTKLLKRAEKSGCKTVNGLGMLFYQGIYSYEIWTGIKLPDTFIKDLYKFFINILKK